MGQLLIEDVSLVKPRDVDAQAVVEAVQAQHVSLQHRRVEQILEAWTTLQLLMPAHGCAISIVIRPCSMELKLRRPQELLAELLDVVFMRSNSVRGHACRTCQRVCEVRRGLWDRIRVPQHEAQYGEKDLVAGNHIHLLVGFYVLPGNQVQNPSETGKVRLMRPVKKTIHLRVRGLPQDLQSIRPQLHELVVDDVGNNIARFDALHGDGCVRRPQLASGQQLDILEEVHDADLGRPQYARQFHLCSAADVCKVLLASQRLQQRGRLRRFCGISEGS
mmetsp:Transcript_4760/g.19047  ORF Transcript_4760/g.19047 Transcript_4760/m.19047 type:complete len:276 (-) Transcript_4760:244-1071(-)